MTRIQTTGAVGYGTAHLLRAVDEEPWRPWWCSLTCFVEAPTAGNRCARPSTTLVEPSSTAPGTTMLGHNWTASVAWWPDTLPCRLSTVGIKGHPTHRASCAWFGLTQNSRPNEGARDARWLVIPGDAQSELRHLTMFAEFDGALVAIDVEVSTCIFKPTCSGGPFTCSWWTTSSKQHASENRGHHQGHRGTPGPIEDLPRHRMARWTRRLQRSEAEASRAQVGNVKLRSGPVGLEPTINAV